VSTVLAGHRFDLPVPVTGVWFDGRSTRRQAVSVFGEGGDLVLRGLDGQEVCRAAGLRCRIAERWAGLPMRVDLPDGSTLVLPEVPDTPVDRGASGVPVLGSISAVYRWINAWRSVLVAVVCLVTLVVWLDRQGISLIAQHVLPLLPQEVDRAIGNHVELLLDEQLKLRPTRMEPARQNRLGARFQAAVEQQHPELTFRVRFADADPAYRFNALALPNGSLLVLDGMSEAFSDDEVLAVLGHEAGHVVHRHSMLALMRSLGLIALSSAIVGDFSSAAASAWSTLAILGYSRDAEREADAFARRFAATASVPPQAMLGVWTKLLTFRKLQGHREAPLWLSTHPPTEERLNHESRMLK
jgi:Zn-dependent protease with chaperone function